MNDIILQYQMDACAKVEDALFANIEKIEEMARYNPQYTYTNYDLIDMYVEYCNIVASNYHLMKNNLNELIKEYNELSAEIADSENYITESVEDWKPVTIIGKIIKFIVSLIKSFVRGVKSLFTTSNNTSRGATATPDQCAQKVFGPPERRIRVVADHRMVVKQKADAPQLQQPKRSIPQPPKQPKPSPNAPVNDNKKSKPKIESEQIVIKASNKGKPVEFKEVFSKNLIGDVIKIKDGRFIIDMTGLAFDDPKQKNLRPRCEDLIKMFSYHTYLDGKYVGTTCTILTEMIDNVIKAFNNGTDDYGRAMSVNNNLIVLNSFVNDEFYKSGLNGIEFLDKNGKMNDIGPDKFARCSSQITELGKKLEKLDGMLNKMVKDLSNKAVPNDKNKSMHEKEVKIFSDTLNRFKDSLSAIMNKITLVIFGITSLQQVMRSKWAVDMRYKHTCSDLNELSKFVEAMIDAGVPGNYIGINTYYVMTKELSGGEGMTKPEWGVSRIAFKPTNDPDHIIKIALNITGINSIKHEREFAENLRSKYGNKTFKFKYGDEVFEQTVVDSFALPDKTNYGNNNCLCKFERAITIESGGITDALGGKLNWESVGPILHGHLRALGVPEAYISDHHAHNVGYIKSKKKFVFIDYSLG